MDRRWSVILKMAPGELLIWKLLEKTKNKIHPFFQSSGIILYAPLESPTVYLPVLGQWVSEAGTL